MLSIWFLLPWNFDNFNFRKKKNVFSLIVAKHKNPLFTPFPKWHHPQFWARGRSVTQGSVDKRLGGSLLLLPVFGGHTRLFITSLNLMPCSSKTFSLPSLVRFLVVMWAGHSCLQQRPKKSNIWGTWICCSFWEGKIIRGQKCSRKECCVWPACFICC